MFILLQPGDTVLGLDLAHAGHLTHGMRLNFSGKLYNAVAYHVGEQDNLVDMDEVECLAREHRSQLMVAGWSAYLRHRDFPTFRGIADEIGAYLMVDIVQFADLVAAGLHPSRSGSSTPAASTSHIPPATTPAAIRDRVLSPLTTKEGGLTSSRSESARPARTPKAGCVRR